MATYKGPNRRAGPRLFWIPSCFTNGAKAAFWAAAVFGGAAGGALVGALIGAVVAVVTGVPLAGTGIGAILAALAGTAEVVGGAILGAVFGASYGLGVAWNSACEECGCCVEILHYQTFWPFSRIVTLVPVFPLVMRPSPGDCTLVPPGCP